MKNSNRKTYYEDETFMNLESIAKESGIHRMTINRYIKDGLLEKPEYIPNKVKRRGQLAVYRKDKDIIQKIKKIRQNLKITHSVEQIKKALNKKIKKKTYINRLQQLLKWAKKDNRYEGAEVEQELLNILNLTKATTVTATSYTFEGVKADE